MRLDCGKLARASLWTAVALTAVLVEAAAAIDPPRLSGHVRYENFTYPDPDRSDVSWENFFEVLVRGRGRLSDTLSYRFEAAAVADTVHFTGGVFSVRNERRRRPYLVLVDGVIDYRPRDDVRIGVGKQIVNWSVFDEIQPLNVTTTRDASDPFRDRELGLYSITVHYEHRFGTVDFMVVPFAFTPMRLPQGRWNIIRDDDVAKIQDLPPVKGEETQAAIRFGFEVEQLELNLVGYVGRDTSAVFIPNLVFVGGEDRFELEIIDRYPQIRVGGLNATYPMLDSLLGRLEIVYYSSPEDYQDNFLHAAFGAEYSLRDFRFVLNYLHEEIIDHAEVEVTDKGERRFFREFLYGELSYDAGGRLECRVRGGYDFRGNFWVLRPEVSYRVWRDLRVRLSGDVIDSETGTDRYFERIRHEDRIGVDMTYSF